MNRDVQQLIRQLTRRGFTVTQLRNGHYRVRAAYGRYLTTPPSTPSCWRSLRNCEADIRRELRKGKR